MTNESRTPILANLVGAYVIGFYEWEPADNCEIRLIPETYTPTPGPPRLGWRRDLTIVAKDETGERIVAIGVSINPEQAQDLALALVAWHADAMLAEITERQSHDQP